jgi:hypothetical protein
LNVFDFDEHSQDINALVEGSANHSATDSFLKQHSVDSIGLNSKSSEICLD